MSMIQWLGPAAGQKVDQSFTQWERDMIAFRKLHKKSIAEQQQLGYEHQNAMMLAGEVRAETQQQQLYMDTNLRTV